MRVFLTGATGYIGSAVADKLQEAGHEVVGLARSDESAKMLQERGIEVQRGDLKDAASVEEGARNADGVIHTAASSGPDAAEADGIAVGAILGALEGTGKPFVCTNGSLAYGDTDGRLAVENDPNDPPEFLAWRAETDGRVLGAAERGVRSIVIRVPLVYGRGGGNFAGLMAMARQESFSRHVGSGQNEWSAVHVDDLADLYVRALERAPDGSLYNVASGEPVSMRAIAEAISRAVGSGEAREWPVEEAEEMMGPFARLIVLNSRLSARKAEEELGWSPQELSVLEDIERGSYSDRATG